MQNDNKNYNSDTSSVGTDDGSYHEQKPKLGNLVDQSDVRFVEQSTVEPLQQRRPLCPKLSKIDFFTFFPNFLDVFIIFFL